MGVIGWGWGRRRWIGSIVASHFVSGLSEGQPQTQTLVQCPIFVFHQTTTGFRLFIVSRSTWCKSKSKHFFPLISASLKKVYSPMYCDINVVKRGLVREVRKSRFKSGFILVLLCWSSHNWRNFSFFRTKTEDSNTTWFLAWSWSTKDNAGGKLCQLWGHL